MPIPANVMSDKSSWAELSTALEQDLTTINAYIVERNYRSGPIEERVVFLENRCSDLIAALSIITAKLAKDDAQKGVAIIGDRRTKSRDE
jgi:phage gp36-like protein